MPTEPGQVEILTPYFETDDMSKIELSVADLVSLMKEVEAEDPLDLGMLSVDENKLLDLSARGVFAMLQVCKSQNMEEKDIWLIMLASMGKLVAENMLLNCRVLQSSNAVESKEAFERAMNNIRK